MTKVKLNGINVSAVVLRDYILYVEGKIAINEMPLTFAQWQDFNKSS